MHSQIGILLRKKFADALHDHSRPSLGQALIFDCGNSSESTSFGVHHESRPCSEFLHLKHPAIFSALCAFLVVSGVSIKGQSDTPVGSTELVGHSGTNRT